MYSLPFTKQKTAKKRSMQGISSRGHVPKETSKVFKKSRQISTVTHKEIASPYLKKIKRYTKQGVKSLLLSSAFHSSFKIVSWVVISFGFVYGSYFFISKTFANEVVVSQSEIVARVARLTPLPAEDPYEIVRVQDETDLRKQNPFYKDIKEGDYILMYKNVAVIYDLRANAIVAVKHVEGAPR